MILRRDDKLLSVAVQLLSGSFSVCGLYVYRTRFQNKKTTTKVKSETALDECFFTCHWKVAKLICFVLSSPVLQLLRNTRAKPS